MHDPKHIVPGPAGPLGTPLSWPRKILFSTVLVLLAAVLMELSLHLLAALVPPVDRFFATTRPSPVISDPRLGWRPIPGALGNDRLGWRNPRVPDAVDVLALGDSQTYGQGVPREHAWPLRIGTLGHLASYNMGYSGWGPAHSLLLMPEALALHPRVVIEGFYSGNDLFDAYALVVLGDQLPSLRTSDPKVQRDLQAAEQALPLRELLGNSWAVFVRTRHIGADEPWSARRMLEQYSKLNALFRAVKAQFKRPDTWEELKTRARGTAGKPKEMLILESGPFRTILSPANRMQVLNLQDARMAEGHRICIDAIAAMDNMARMAAGKSPRPARLPFLVLLLPTKELVMYEVALNTPGAVNDTYREMVRREQRVLDATRQALAARGIAYVEALPALRQCLRNGQQPYPIENDGHPTAVGHAAIARQVLRFLDERRALEAP
jgi:hypothetical protein